MTVSTSGPELPLPELNKRLVAIDAALVGRAAAGEQQAFDQIYDALFPVIWSLSVRRGLLQRDAEQLTERILERVVLSLDAYPPDVSFTSWLRARIAEEVPAFERTRKRRAASRSTSSPAPQART